MEQKIPTLQFDHSVLAFDNNFSSSENYTTRQVTSYNWPWPKEIHEYYPHINLFSNTRIMGQSSFGKKIQFQAYNFTHPIFGWLKSWKLNRTFVHAYYMKYYGNSGKPMLICNANLFSKVSPYASFHECFNYTVKDFIRYQQHSLSYTYKQNKPSIDYFISFVVIFFVLGSFGKKYTCIR